MISLAGTELVVSSLCLGTADIGSGVTGEAAYRLLDKYVDLGGNFLDTAAVYANWLPGERNVSEKTLGRWIRARKNRDALVIATKGAHPELETMHISRLSPTDIISDLDTSLRNLNTDRIDLYYLHRDDSKRPVETIIDTLESQVKLGKIRYYGCSNWRVDRIRQAQDYARSCGVSGFVADQMMWSLAELNWEFMPDKTIVAMSPELYQYHCDTGLAAIPYSSQAKGFFHKLANAESSELPPSLRGLLLTPENSARFRRLQILCAETGLTITQVVLGYLRSHPFMVIPIIGCKNEVHLSDSMSTRDIVLTRKQVHFLQHGS